MNKSQLRRKLLLLFAMVMLFTFKVEAKRVEGKIIFDNDTVDVTFNIPFTLLGNQPDFQRLQKKVKYYDASGNRKVLKPDQAREIQFSYDSQQVRMLSRAYKGAGSIFSITKTQFIKLEVDGEVKMFAYYDTRPSAGTIHNSLGKTIPAGGVRQVKVELMQKQEGELKRLKTFTFRQDMITFFNDCPQLSQKIESREFRRMDLASIITFYNTSCGK
jgi:predicted Zn-ribbon and HTH transcriptional regulator